jgi:threonine synthase
MQLLGRMMDYVLTQRGLRATIVGATSGDTGGAAIEAFRGRDRTDIFILFPDGRVSNVQRRQMTTPTEANVHALALTGNFDDCQAIVKGMFNHFNFRDRVALSGVNSINWARIWLRSSTTSWLVPHWAHRIAKCPSPCRPATSGTSSPAMPP